MSYTQSNAWLKGLVNKSLGFSPGGIEVTSAYDQTNGLLTSQLRGQYAEMTRLNRVFGATAAAVTLPVNASTLVSKFGVYNPPNSGVNLELIDVDAHAVLATTVVDALGLYFSNGANATGATFTTLGTVQCMNVGGPPGGVAQFYSAVTHVGTPTLLRIIGGWGAVTDGGSTAISKEFNGSVIVPPGTLLALAMTTAASTGSGITLGMTWAEVPIQ